MKSKRFYIFILFLFSVFAYSSVEAEGNNFHAVSKSCITVKSCSNTSQPRHTGDSPFIRFHHGIGENSISISSQSESIIPLKPVNSIPEKFAGIVEYISSLSDRLPVTRVFLYATPLRSPPAFC